MIKDLAPGITRKRLILEGFYRIEADESTIEAYLLSITESLNLRIYSSPIIFATGDQGKEENKGYDAFVPLIDSGISCYVWVSAKFLSIIIYTCKDFDDHIAVEKTKQFFKIKELEWSIF